MTEARVQIPDDLFERAKATASARKCSFAELVKLGLESIVGGTRPPQQTRGPWEPPQPRDLGEFLAPEGEWTEIAHSDL